MKSIILKTISGLALLALVPVIAEARVNVNLDLGIPLYVEPPQQYYAPPPPVYYGPTVIYRHDRDWDDRRWDDRRWDHRHGHDGRRYHR